MIFHCVLGLAVMSVVNYPSFIFYFFIYFLFKRTDVHDISARCSARFLLAAELYFYLIDN